MKTSELFRQIQWQIAADGIFEYDATTTVIHWSDRLVRDVSLYNSLWPRH